MNVRRHPKLSHFYDFVDPLKGVEHIPILFVELMDTPAFQRLKHLRFLGGIDYLLIPSPNGTKFNIRFTRHQHTLGVARLALHYAEMVGLSERDLTLVYVSALLHDIGHAPLSHSLEPVFQEHFGINHHSARNDILTASVPLGVEVYHLLKSAKIEPDSIIEILDGQVNLFDGFFAGPINIDTIEGILRSQRYFKSSANSPTPIAVLHSATQRKLIVDQNIVDSFWKLKNDVYNTLIRSHDGVLADYICQKIAWNNIHLLSRNDFFLTESQLFRKISEFKRTLNCSRYLFQVRENLEEIVKYQARYFYIDSRGNFFLRQDKDRYKQAKKDLRLNSTAPQSTSAEAKENDLFDVASI